MRRSLETLRNSWQGLQFLLVIGLSTFFAGCGGSSNPVNPPVAGAPTNVVVLLTSTANDKLTQFALAITSVSLRDSAGNTVTLFNDPSRNGVSGLTEFMRLNGTSQPLVTASVPQAIYTSATVKVSYCHFATVTVVAGGLVQSFDAQGVCGQGTGNTTVNLPSPITISGPAMALSFNLQVTQSYTLTATNQYTISPVFTVTSAAISANPTNDGNGKISGINARITSVDVSGNSFVAQTADGISLTLSANSTTVYQGLAGLSNLAQGTLVNLDSAIQPTGTLLATRVEVQNPGAVTSDLMLPLTPASPAGTTVAQPSDCFPAPGAVPVCHGAFFTFTGTAFHVSGQFSNLQGLPFTPTFNSSSSVLGQSFLVSSTSSQLVPGGLLATDITLEPQTINGTVTAVANAGGFSIYTVRLAPYQVIPTTQQLPVVAPFAAIASPSTVLVYADANTQLLQSGPIAPGSLLRFRGLVFSDNGTLRMDCARILDGVTP
ncbi:MAG TPA: hypothetical protein VF532_17860 [Candidatus Angelobacter sp.]